MSSSPHSTSASRPKTGRRSGVPNLGLQVDPRDLEFRPLRWWDWWREVRRTSSAGLTISLLLHVVACVLLAVWIIDQPDRTDADPYLVTWLDPTATVKPTTKSRRPVSIPLTVATVTPSPAPPPKLKPADVPATPTVRAADVGQALMNRGRVARGEIGELEQLGGSAAAQRAVKAGLAWLARQQTKDGRWELHQGYPDAGLSVIRTDTGATALALLAFLGAGHTPQDGDHAQNVQNGLRWLVDIQDPATGDLHDQRQEEGRQAAFYAHAMATIALCEALALTRDEALREPAQKAVGYLLQAQHPDTGGWKYRPLSRMMVGDLSVTGWALMALHTARMAGIDVPDHDFVRAFAFLDSVAERGGSRYKYEPHDPPERITVALTAEGILCRQWLGWGRDHPPLRDAVAFLTDEEHRPQWAAGRRNVYSWYYTAQVLHNLGGEAWESWYLPTRDLVVKSQVTGGSARSPNDVRGSWHPTQPPGADEEYGQKAGRLYVTAMCLLLLETPYRHRPLYPTER